jgi:hypothetical protein
MRRKVQEAAEDIMLVSPSVSSKAYPSFNGNNSIVPMSIPGTILRSSNDEHADFWSSKMYDQTIYLVDLCSTTCVERVYRDDVRLVSLTWQVFINCCTMLKDCLTIPLSERKRLQQEMDVLAERLAQQALNAQQQSADQPPPLPPSEIWFFMRKSSTLSPLLFWSQEEFQQDVSLFYDVQSLSISILGHSGGDKLQVMKHDIAWMALSRQQSPFAFYNQIEQRLTIVNQTENQQQDVESCLTLQDLTTVTSQQQQDTLLLSLAWLYPTHRQLTAAFTRVLSLFRGSTLSIVFTGYSTTRQGDWLLADESTFSAMDCIHILQQLISTSIGSVLSCEILIHSLFSQRWVHCFQTEVTASQTHNKVGLLATTAIPVEQYLTQSIRLSAIPVCSNLTGFSPQRTTLTLNNIDGEQSGLVVSMFPMDVRESRSFLVLRTMFEKVVDMQAWQRWQALDGLVLRRALSAAVKTPSASSQVTASSSRMILAAVCNSSSSLSSASSMPTASVGNVNTNSVEAQLKYQLVVSQSITNYAATHGLKEKDMLWRRLRHPRLYLFPAQAGGGALFIWKEKNVLIWIAGKISSGDRRQQLEQERIVCSLTSSFGCQTVVCLPTCDDTRVMNVRRFIQQFPSSSSQQYPSSNQATVQTVIVMHSEVMSNETNKSGRQVERTPSNQRGRTRTRSFSSDQRGVERSKSPLRSTQRSSERNCSSALQESSLKNNAEEKQLGRDWTYTQSLSQACARQGIPITKDGTFNMAQNRVSIHILPPIQRSRTLSRSQSRSRSPSATMPRSQSRSRLCSASSPSIASLRISCREPKEPKEEPTPDPDPTTTNSDDALAFIVEVQRDKAPPALLLFCGQVDARALAERLSVWRRRTHRDRNRTHFHYADVPISFAPTNSLVSTMPSTIVDHFESFSAEVCGVCSEGKVRSTSERFLNAVVGKRVVFNWRDNQQPAQSHQQTNIDDHLSPWVFAIREKLKCWKFPPDEGSALELDFSICPGVTAVSLSSL